MHLSASHPIVGFQILGYGLLIGFLLQLLVNQGVDADVVAAMGKKVRDGGLLDLVGGGAQGG